MSSAIFKENVCHFSSGMLGGMAGLVVGYPPDTIKVRQQTEKLVPMMRCVKDLLINEGVRGFFKGMSFPLIAVGVNNSIFFGVYGSTIQLMQALRTTGSIKWSETAVPPPPTYLDMFVVGGFAGAIQAISATPMELVKVRLQVQHESPHMFPNLYKGSFDCLRCLVRQKGWRGPFKGLGLTVVRDSTSFCIYISLYQIICDSLTPNYEVNQSSAGAMLFAGGTAGTLSWYNLPIDMIKSRMQADSTSNPRYTDWRSCAEEIYLEGGWRAFYRGIVAVVIRTFPMNAVTFFAYEHALRTMRSMLHIDKNSDVR